MPPAGKHDCRWPKRLPLIVVLMMYVLQTVLCAERPNDDLLIKEAITSLNLKNASCVAFAGDNDAGINELKKFLRHDESLTVEKVNNKFQLKANEEKTHVPTISVDLESRSRLFTLTNAAPDLPAQLFNRRVLETTSSLKIVIVENFSKLLGDNYYETLTKAVKNVVGILGNRLQWYNDSLSLVTTKIDRPNLNDTEVINEVKYKVNQFVKHIEKQRDEALENNDLELAAELDGYITVGKFLLQKKAFGILRTPTAKKSPWDLPPLKKNYNQLRKLIFERLDFSSRIGSAAEIVVTEATRKEIENLYLPRAEIQMNDTLAVFAASLDLALYGKLFNQFDTFAANLFPAALDRLTSFAQLESLAKLLDVPSKSGEDVVSVAYLIEFYYEITKNSFDDYEEREIAWVKSQFDTILFDAFSNHEFLSSFRRDFETRQVQQNLIRNQSVILKGLSVDNFAHWQTGLEVLGFTKDTFQIATNGNEMMVTQITSIVKSVPPIEVSYSTDILLYSGYYVFLSEVKKLILENSPFEVEVLAMRKLFVDCDLHLQDIHFTIIASEVEVKLKYHITLTGSNESEPNPVPGSSGSSGYSSGQFHLVVQEVINPSLLAIHAYGGNGTDGVDGEKGKDVDLDAYFEQNADMSYRCGSSCHMFDKMSEINQYHGPKYQATHETYDCDLFGNNCDRWVWVTKNGNVIPEQGGKGGNAGAGALPGMILELGSFLQTFVTNGTNGKPGIGGEGGTVLQLQRKYNCEAIFGNTKHDCDPRYVGGNQTSYKYKKGPEGETGEFAVSLVTNYKRTKQRNLFDAFLRLNLLAVFSASPVSPDEIFLRFASREILVEEFTTIHFFQFLSAVQDALVNTTHTANLKIVTQSFYESFIIFKELGKESNTSYLALIELMFVDTISKCDSLFTGRQIVKLSDKISNEILRLDGVKDIQQDLFVYETVKEEGEKAVKLIKEAENTLRQFYEEEMLNIQDEIESELEELVKNVYEEQEECRENIAELRKKKEKYEKAMKRKVMGKIFKSVLQISSAFFPLSGLTGLAALSLGITTKRKSGIEELLPEISHAADTVALVIAEYLLQRETDTRSRQEAQLVATNLFLNDTGIADEVLSEQEYEDALRVLEESIVLEDVEDERWNKFYQTFDNLEEKIVDASSHVVGEENLLKLDVFKTVFKAAKSEFICSENVLNFVREIQSANVNLDMFYAAMEATAVAIQQLEAYRKLIADLYMPMLEDMRDQLDNMQTDLKDANSLLKGIKAFELKRKIGEFTDFIFRFTEGLMDDDGFAALSSELQEVVRVLADCYERIEEISNRLELKQFFGRIVGGDCSQATNFETCIAYETARAEMDKSHLLVAFIEIFAVYRRVIFPFGADKVKILGRVVEKLRETDLESAGAIKVVQDSLGLLRNELEDMSTSITNQDNDIIYAIFNPKYISGRSFYTWPAGNEFLAQIEDLINGKEIKLVASATDVAARNVVKFKVAMLNFTSTDPKVNSRVQELLLSFRLEATHVGPSRYRCGTADYVIGGAPLQFSIAYERDEYGNPIEINESLSNLKNGDVPLSPYSVWRFRLEHIASNDVQTIREEMLMMAGLLNLELIGEGYYIKEESDICNNLNSAYEDIELQF